MLFISGQSSWQQSLARLQEAQNGGGPAAFKNDWMPWDFFRPPGVQLNVVHLGAAMSSIAKALLTL